MTSNYSTPRTERKESIDAVKGFAIFAVVVGHVIANFFDSWSNTLQEEPVVMYWWRLIYSFHMPLMMFVSGYLFLSSRVLTDNPFKVWLHKIQPLIFPFMLMGLVLYLLRGSKDSYWYLRTLGEFVTIQLIYEHLRKKFHFSWIGDFIWLVFTWYISAILLGKCYTIPYFNFIVDIQHFQWVWIYFCIGVMFRRYNVFGLLAFKNSESLFLLLFSIYCIYTIGGGKNVLLVFSQIAIVCIIIAIFQAFNQYRSESLVMQAFKYMGKHTLEIYIIHGFFLFKMPEIGSFISSKCLSLPAPLTGLSIEILVAIILSLINVAMSAAVYEPLKAFPLIYRLFLGRDVSKK